MKEKIAIFAGGCFWCMVKPFDELPGIIEVESGYIGGTIQNPRYQEVKAGTSGHFEAVRITYDSEKMSYQQLLDLYWPQVDPTDDGGQFIDRGTQYRTAIFYTDIDQKELAERSLEKVMNSGIFQGPIVTQVLPATKFFIAEEEHQKFYKKNPDAFQKEQEESGREAFSKANWTWKSE